MFLCKSKFLAKMWHYMFSEEVNILSTEHHNTAKPAALLWPAAQLLHKNPFIQHQAEEQLNNCFLLVKSPPHCWCLRNLRLYVVLLCSLLGMGNDISALLQPQHCKPSLGTSHDTLCVIVDQSQYAHRQLALAWFVFSNFIHCTLFQSWVVRSVVMHQIFS